MGILLYILSLGLSAGLVGVFGNHTLRSLGYVPDFSAGMAIAGIIGGVWITTQLLYVFLLRILAPTRSAAPLFFESLSHITALLLVPHLAGLEIPWPKEVLFKLEPLLYLGVFIGIHILIKFMSFFCALQNKPSSRSNSVGWLAATAVACCVVWFTGVQWQENRLEAKIAPAVAPEPHAIRHAWVNAHPVKEGETIPIERVPYDPATNLSFLIGLEEEQKTLEELHLTLWADSQPVYQTAVEVLSPWNAIRFPASALETLSGPFFLQWHTRPPDLLNLTGLNAGGTSSTTAWFSPPLLHSVRIDNQRPNIIVIVVEGLTASHLNFMGYHRNTANNLKKLAGRSIVYSNAFTTAPELPAACGSLFTGASPLRHGVLGEQKSVLNQALPTIAEAFNTHGYATAAFTEGKGLIESDLVVGSGFERGFELFNVAYPVQQKQSTSNGALPGSVIPRGSQPTLRTAARWINQQKQEHFLAFIRLRELRHPQLLPHYKESFGSQKNPSPLDIYDTAIAEVDEDLGEFFSELNDMQLWKNTCIVITSSYGLDYNGRSPEGRLGLSEANLHVPLIITLPENRHRLIEQPVSIQDLPSTLADLAGLAKNPFPTGINLIRAQSDLPSLSMAGRPLQLSLRTADWRFTWDSGRFPFSDIPEQRAKPVALLNIHEYQAGTSPGNALQSQTALVEQFSAYLRNYIQEQTTGTETNRIGAQ